MTQIRSGLAAVVTGAGSGVGEAVAVALACAGIRVALVGRTAAKLERVQQTIAAGGGECAVFFCDVAQPHEVAALKDAVAVRFGDPQVLFNAAGIACEALPIAETTPEQWLETMAINAHGPYLTARAFLPGMLRQGWGRIINVSSAASISLPWSVSAVYQLSKVTLNWFTRQLAAEVAGTGVTANALHPGEVKTEMWAAIKAEASSRPATGRAFLDWAEWVEETGGDPPEKTADLVLELLSPESDWVNGQFLWIKDGLQEARAAW
jgi:NAD(P)-dependent dehydrogenase (short-subunit alcohol dehydrogenase family)